MSTQQFVKAYPLQLVIVLPKRTDQWILRLRIYNSSGFPRQQAKELASISGNGQITPDEWQRIKAWIMSHDNLSSLNGQLPHLIQDLGKIFVSHKLLDKEAKSQIRAS